ncbi:MAG: hypothetical protein AAFO04_26055 [Cyanobacteria bacterium J06592_8]
MEKDNSSEVISDSTSDPSLQSTQGILYYARGERWIQEVLQSAQSVKVAMPEIKTAILSDTQLPKELFDIQIKAPSEVGVKQLKMWSLRQTPFQKTLYLDTDTYVADSLWEIFEMLDQFDLALAVTPYWKIDLHKNGGNIEEKGVPVCFPKLNTGVIAYQKNQQTNRLFANWAKLHKEWGEGQDQAPFRNTLYNSDIRFGVLPPAYNYRLPYPDGIWGCVKIFHGRHQNLPNLCKNINRSQDWRITSPIKYKDTSIFYEKRNWRQLLKRGMKKFQSVFQGNEI